MAGTRQHGVSLIELLTVLVVISILATFAIPSYRQYLLRSQRSDATAALLRVQAAQEKFFLQNNSYSANLAAAPPAGLGLSVESENRYYTIAVALTGGGAGFNASAAPRAGSGQDADTACASFTINQNGTKGAVDAGGADHRELCWK